ncbi:hypothetical protein CJU75_23125 [Pseudomonas fragi]|nr:hypothetical protein CJU75_23125 [Pseudomonas fragi]
MDETQRIIGGLQGPNVEFLLAGWGVSGGGTLPEPGHRGTDQAKRREGPLCILAYNQKPCKLQKVTEALDQGLVDLWLTRFACWAFTITAPFGHCTGDHLDL